MKPLQVSGSNGGVERSRGSSLGVTGRRRLLAGANEVSGSWRSAIPRRNLESWTRRRGTARCVPAKEAAGTSQLAQGLGVGEKPAEVECVGTSMDVECLFVDEQDIATEAGTVVDSAALEVDNGKTASGAEIPLWQRVAGTALLVSPFFFWGTSMVVMKQLGPHTTPLFVATVRLIPAGALILAWAAAAGRKQPQTLQAWVWILAFGLVDGAMFQGFLAEGLERTQAGLGSVIIDSQPLTVAVLAALLFQEELGGKAVAGLALGVLGLALLEVPPDALPGLLSGGLGAAGGQFGWQEGSVWDSGEFWMLLAAQSMAVGTVMVRYVSRYCDPVVATGWHMVLGGIPLLGFSLAQEWGELGQRVPLLTSADAASFLYISVLGSAASYGVFFYNASKGNLTRLSSLTFLTPVFAATAGYLILQETLTPLQLTGATAAMFAVYLINTRSQNASD